MYRKIRNYAESNLSKHRLEHSLSTALICVDLCSRFGLDDQKGRIAGIAHDIAREQPFDKTTINSINDGYPVSAEEKLNPVLLHGRIAASLLISKFGLDDIEILQAVRWHTSGHPDMGRLGQVLFVADYIEPGREHINKSFRDIIMTLNLNDMTLKILNNQIAYLRSNGYRISQSSMYLYDKLSNPAKIINS